MMPMFPQMEKNILPISFLTIETDPQLCCLLIIQWKVFSLYASRPPQQHLTLAHSFPPVSIHLSCCSLRSFIASLIHLATERGMSVAPSLRPSSLLLCSLDCLIPTWDFHWYLCAVTHTFKSSFHISECQTRELECQPSISIWLFWILIGWF